MSECKNCGKCGNSCDPAHEDPAHEEPDIKPAIPETVGQGGAVASSTDDFRSVLYTINKSGHRNWVYNTFQFGKFFKLRTAVAAALLVIYLGAPWLTIDGKQAILLSIRERKFVFFGSTFWATDTAFLFLMLAAGGLTLFLASAAVGRMWCGWACPHTVFLDFIFRPIERLIEGSPAQRLKLDGSPWTPPWIFKKGLKLFFYLVVAWILSSTLLVYFWGREELFGMMSQSPLHNLQPFILTVIGAGVLLFEFGWFREQFCTLVCPYARFQSVLVDSQSLIVGYDVTRGEPRGKSKEAGDCIDCGLCVRVCPTGIDIRNGLQLECIQCTACIDACDSIMHKLKRPSGLIRLDTEQNLRFNAGKPFTLARPRVFIYGSILAVVLTVFIVVFSNRSLTDFQIVRGARDLPYSLLDNGVVLNHLHLELANKADTRQILSVTVEGPAGTSLVIPPDALKLEPGEIRTTPIFVSAPRSAFQNGILKVTFVLLHENNRTERLPFSLLGPT